MFDDREQTVREAGSGASWICARRIHADGSIQLADNSEPESLEIRGLDVDRRTAADRIRGAIRKKRDGREVIARLRVCLERGEEVAVGEIVVRRAALSEPRRY